jgi:orotate phosphoribosyltransferase
MEWNSPSRRAFVVREAFEALRNARALICDSHVEYTSGRHGRDYLDKNALYTDTRVTRLLTLSMAEPFSGERVQTVVGPATGGIILSQLIAHHLTMFHNQRVRAIFAAKIEGGGFGFPFGYDEHIAGQRVLVVEDVLTTGGTVRKVIELIRKHGGEPFGLSVLCNRGGLTAPDFPDMQFVPLLEAPLESWAPEDCPLCEAGVPIDDRFGKRKKLA